jgi:hypothetical protein
VPSGLNHISLCRHVEKAEKRFLKGKTPNNSDLVARPEVPFSTVQQRSAPAAVPRHCFDQFVAISLFVFSMLPTYDYIS